MNGFLWFVVGITIVMLGDAISDYISARADRINVSVEERRAKLEAEKKAQQEQQTVEETKPLINE